MSAQIFIDKLEASNLLDASVINKLRSKVAKPGKIPPAESVAKYCLEKGFLTQVQADRLLESVAQEAENLEEVEPTALEATNSGTVLTAADLVTEDEGGDIVDLQPVIPLDVPAAGVVGTPTATPGLVDPLAASTPAPLSAVDPYGGALGNNGETDPTAQNTEETKTREFKGKKIQEQSFESRWIILGSASLVILLLLGWFFATVIMKGNSDEVFREAEEMFAGESYPAAVEAYKEFIKNFQGDPNTRYARVKFRVAEMKIAASGKDVPNTVKVFQDNIEKITLIMADQIQNAPFKTEIRKMIALDTITVAQKAANAAANQVTVEEKEVALEEAKDMMRLVNDGKFVPRSERELPSFASMIESTEATLNNVENTIIRVKDTSKAVTEARDLIEQGETYQAFEIYDQLITRHPGAETDQEVIKVVREISEKEQQLVRKMDALAENFTDVQETASPSINGRVTLATSTGKEFADLKGTVDVHLIDGVVYGVDLGTGRLVWRKFVGYETEINPVWLDNPRRVLISEQKHHRIMLVEPNSGKTVWYKNIGEPFLPPTVAGNKIFISMVSGKVARVDSESGNLAAIVQLPQRLNVSATANASGNVLYQAGEHLNVYVLSASLTDITCVQAFYTGHRDNAVRVPPKLLQGALVLPVNVDSTSCELRILNNVPDKMELKTAGEDYRLKANLIQPMKLLGNYLVAVAVNGDISVFELAGQDGELSLAVVAKKSLNIPPSQEIFFATGNGKIWVGTRGILQYAVVVAKQAIQEKNVSNNADDFVGELSVFENLLVHQRKRFGSRMTSLAAVDPDRLSEVWRLDIGGGFAGAPLVDNESVLAVNSQGDFYALGPEAVASGFSHQPTHRTSRTQQNLVFTRSIGFPDGSAFIIGPPDRKEAISFIPTDNVLPASLSRIDSNNLEIPCDPVKFKDGALLGFSNGEIRLFIPRTAGKEAIFVPEAKVGDEFLWQRPCILSADTFAVANHDGKVFTIKYVPNNGTPYLAQILNTKVASKIIGPLVSNGKLIYTLVEGPNGNDVMAINPSDLKIKGKYSLGGILTWGPESAGDLALATSHEGELIAFGDDVNKPVWTVKLPSGRLTGRPISWNGKIVLTLKDGQVALVAADGSNVQLVDTGEPISGDSSLSGNQLYVGGANGSICVLDLSKVE